MKSPLEMPAIRVPVRVTTVVGMRAFRPLNETAILESLHYQVRHLPERALWMGRYRVEDMRLLAWRLKNVDLPNWQKTRGK